MSDANRIDLAYEKESSYGVLPTGNSAKLVRVASESVGQNTDSARSREIRSDRQVADIIRTGLGVGGQVTAELSYGTFDDWFQWGFAASGADWAATVSSGAITAAIASNVITRSSGSFVTDGFAVGKWVKMVSGWDSANNGLFGKITALTATTMTLGACTLTNEGSGSGKTVTQQAYIENGTTLTTFALERKYGDLSNEFAQFLGCGINGVSLAVNTKSIIEVTFDVFGKKEQSATSSMDSNGYTAAPSNDVMNAIDHVVAVYEGGYAGGNVLGATKFSAQLGNNLRQREQVGSLGAVSLGMGTFDVRGTLTAYFETKTLFDKYLNWTKTSLSILLKDAAGNRYFLDLPALRIGSGRRVAGGQNTDIIADLTIEGYRDSTEGITARLSRGT